MTMGVPDEVLIRNDPQSSSEKYGSRVQATTWIGGGSISAGRTR